MLAQFPGELSALVLDQLQQPDLIRAAHVSQAWRVVALGHPSFYASFTLRNTQFHTGALRILGAIRLAFPHLVHLSVSIDAFTGTLSTALRDALQEPAPVLEALFLPAVPEFPTNFLGGSAPKLRVLSILRHSALPFAHVFPSVETLSLSGPYDSMSNMGIRFPGVTQLRLESIRPTSVDTVALDICFPNLESLRLSAWTPPDLAWVNLTEQTRSIPSITAQFSTDQLFNSRVPELVQCLGDTTHLSVSTTTMEREYIAIRLQDGIVTRTVLRFPLDPESPWLRGSQPLQAAVDPIASRITHLTFDYLLLSYVAPAVLAHLSSVQRIEVDLRRLVSVSLKHRDALCCTHEVTNRHVVDRAEFERLRDDPTLDRPKRNGARPRSDHLGLAWHVQNINLIRKGVVKEDLDAELLRTVFSDVQYVTVVWSPPRSSTRVRMWSS
ncbi:hypothetical protein EXIGLDRAFT_843448 [Exidia glandulosa HHB12029]|uniref:F-box domain-containing protein n=1 Tax=Exidia glandulosa HHB12029 TaxID=1314781 RepID=A0A165CMY8_EXIGL|nr:hypothetical protein EXIGLDRAFT_843448 [Exidia glandulosa HHB12029]